MVWKDDLVPCTVYRKFHIENGTDEWLAEPKDFLMTLRIHHDAL